MIPDFRLALLPATALSLALTAAPTRAAQTAAYSCSVPRALLCENCASAIAITLSRDGACRVTFTPGAPATGGPGANLPLNFNVEVPRPEGARTLRRRAAWGREVAALRSNSVHPARSRCFVFNGSEYCE
jgi:hypothetical protein